MAEALAEHLARLPEPQLQRLAERVIGSPLHERALTERAVAQRLLDPEWIDRTIRHLGARAVATLTALINAGVPVVRRDVSALVSGSADPVEALEEHGLLTAIRTGRGMPTHIAITPGLEELVRSRTSVGAASSAADGLWLAGARRRFELALMVATVAQHPPRMTKDGRLHARDLGTLTERLDPLGHRVAAIERRLARWHEIGAVIPNGGRLCVVPELASNIPELQQRLALSELAAPSLPEGALAAVRILLASGAAMPIRTVLEAAQAELLRDRAVADESELRTGARRELMEVMSALLALEAVVLLDAEGQPILASSDDLFRRASVGEDLAIALDPLVAAGLRNDPVPNNATQTGHVQSSFEIVADASCDPSLIARIGMCARVVRADRAAVLRLERDSVKLGKALGVSLESLLDALARISDRPVPMNVETILRDWYTSAPTPRDVPFLDAVEGGQLRRDALQALRRGP